jgi:hypothetical protein
MQSENHPTILTAAGHYFNFVDLKDNVVSLYDIAQALSHICRFTGHTREFYSVAQHSVLVSRIVSPKHARIALYHDAAEAYLGDVSRPLKSLLPDYQAIERRVQADILKKLGLPEEIPEEVKKADRILLATEQRDLMPAHYDVWPVIADIEPLPDRIEPWAPWDAYRCFVACARANGTSSDEKA